MGVFLQVQHSCIVAITVLQFCSSHHRQTLSYVKANKENETKVRALSPLPKHLSDCAAASETTVNLSLSVKAML